MQTKTASAVETLTDIGTGFLIAWGVYLWVVLPYVDLQAAFTITCIFTGVSLVRRYLWRRFFARGLHAVLWRRVWERHPAGHIRARVLRDKAAEVYDSDTGPNPW